LTPPHPYSDQHLARDAALAESLAAEIRRLAQPDAAEPPQRRELLDLSAHFLDDLAADATRAERTDLASAAGNLRAQIATALTTDHAELSFSILAEGIDELRALLSSPTRPTSQATTALNTTIPAEPPAEPATEPAIEVPVELATEEPVELAIEIPNEPAPEPLAECASELPTEPALEAATDPTSEALTFAPELDLPAALNAPLTPALDPDTNANANTDPSTDLSAEANTTDPDPTDPTSSLNPIEPTNTPAPSPSSITTICDQLSALAASFDHLASASDSPPIPDPQPLDSLTPSDPAAAPSENAFTQPEPAAPEASNPPTTPDTPEPLLLTLAPTTIAIADDELVPASVLLSTAEQSTTSSPSDAPTDPAPTDLSPAPELEVAPSPLAPSAELPDPPSAPTDPTAPQVPPDSPETASTGELTPDQIAALMAGDSASNEEFWGSLPLTLDQSQLESLQFVTAEVTASLDQIEQAHAQLAQFGTREEGCIALRETAATLDRLVGQFFFVSVQELRNLIVAIADGILTVPEPLIPELLIRVRAVHTLIQQHIRGLEVSLELRWPLATLRERIDILLAGRPLHPDLIGWHNNDPERLLELDLVSEGVNSPPRPPTSEGTAEQLQALTAARNAAQPATKDTEPAAATATVRVPAAVLDELVNTSSQLVLTKNRLVSLARLLRASAVNDPRLDELTTATDELAQLSAAVQASMMRARMQPITRLFERYPRVVRDVANMMGKQVELLLAGESTHVDKAVFEGLAEPLTHILRDLVARWIQTPSDRQAAGKSPSATITLDAENLGNQVLISITHDGSPPDPEPLIARAIAAGVLSADQAASLPSGDLYALAYHPTVADPDQAVVARALATLRGRASITISPNSTRIELTLPLELAIIESILIAVGPETYALPLRYVQEIVKITPSDTKTVRGRPVFVLRDHLVPLINLHSLVRGDRPPADAPAFGIVVAAAGDTAALLVDRIVGRQEVVIKPLDNATASESRLFAGATIRDDGEVSLVFETERLLATAATEAAAMAA
jgi:two-component system, chemotaxis family, sensor kinase CheA